MDWVRGCRLLAAAGVVSAVTSLTAQEGVSTPIPERARGATRVVVATVTETNARVERNEFGDELIVTHATLAVEEAIKGPAQSVTFALEGGTLNGLTLRVSSLPSLEEGERAVFFLTPGRSGEFRPYLRGQGILKLDANNRVRSDPHTHTPATNLTLEEIRRLARSAVQ